MALLIGLVGEKLSGKDTVANYLVNKHGGEHIRHSLILDKILEILDLEITRRNEIDLGMGLRQIFGQGILGKAIRKKVRDSKAQIIIISGIRFEDEFNLAKELGAKIIYITADTNIRFKRYKERAEKKDDGLDDFDQFIKVEQEPTEITIPSLGKKADAVIVNNSSLPELYKRVDELIQAL